MSHEVAADLWQIKDAYAGVFTLACCRHIGCTTRSPDTRE